MVVIDVQHLQQTRTDSGTQTQFGTNTTHCDNRSNWLASSSAQRVNPCTLAHSRCVWIDLYTRAQLATWAFESLEGRVVSQFEFCMRSHYKMGSNVAIVPKFGFILSTFFVHVIVLSPSI